MTERDLFLLCREALIQGVMARKPQPPFLPERQLRTIIIKVPTNPVIVRYIKALHGGQLWGDTFEKTSERLIADAIQREIGRGALRVRHAQPRDYTDYKPLTLSRAAHGRALDHRNEEVERVVAEILGRTKGPKDRRALAPAQRGGSGRRRRRSS